MVFSEKYTTQDRMKDANEDELKKLVISREHMALCEVIEELTQEIKRLNLFLR